MLHVCLTRKKNYPILEYAKLISLLFSIIKTQNSLLAINIELMMVFNTLIVSKYKDLK